MTLWTELHVTHLHLLTDGGNVKVAQVESECPVLIEEQTVLKKKIQGMYVCTIAVIFSYMTIFITCT